MKDFSSPSTKAAAPGCTGIAASLSVSGVSIFAACGNSVSNCWRIENSWRVKAAMVVSDRPFRATMWCEKLMVFTSSSGRSGEPNVPEGISTAS